ncbi:MAG: hypothetical protein JJ900_12685 [Rhodospirillales bacterium]|nr:hypothetical protein [Rhodospirillales bacterium]MBO6787701.1 hypothetical protein [Rhodospirillales bacterium]
MFSLLKELFRFMRAYRKFWMAPLILGLLALGVLLIAAQSSAITPFIYAIF